VNGIAPKDPPRSELERAAGALIVGGFRGEDLPDDVARDLASTRLGGVVLFRRNIRSLEQVHQLNTAVHRADRGPGPPIVAVDQEGGPVARLRGLVTDLPAMAQVGRTGDVQLSAELGEMVGTELSALGFNVDFAPVMDVHTRPENPVIGARAFGSDPARVAHMAGAFAVGLLISGVVPCVKHFPGHGDTRTDSHLELPVVDKSREQLMACELVPFQGAARAELPMVMTGHLSVPALDPDLPATLSPAIIDGLLRRELGFQGVVISDDLEMAATADAYSVEELVRLGLRAGVDVFLFCHSRDRQRRALEALVRLAESDPEDRRRLERAHRRVLQLRQRFLAPFHPEDPDWRAPIRTEAHLALAARVPPLA
jgi:beta-N-acetylhexosaminidase